MVPIRSYPIRRRYRIILIIKTFTILNQLIIYIIKTQLLCVCVCVCVCLFVKEMEE